MVKNAADQSLSGAQAAASQPFQMPVAPVAGFNPQQQQAFNQYSSIQGMAQPYFNQAANYTSQSAAPITGADVNQYYNPMADSVTAQLKNIYGQQNSQNQGMLTQQAGGVGAERIATGMGDLANQQTLGAGQIYAGLYQQALQAAQQQKQMAAGAGSAFAGYGTGAQTAALQGTGALGQSGQIQQAQSQAELNAPYQNQLAKIAYQFQTPQYLAGIAGGLAPALGGTTIGNQQTTAPSPSMISQILGLGTAGVGLAGSAGAFGGGTSGVGSYGQTANASGLGAGTGGMSFPMFAEGGGTLTDNVFAHYMARHKALGGKVRSFAEGGETEDQGPAIPGVHLPKAGGATPIPTVSLPMGGGHSGPLTGGLNFPSPQQSSGSGDSTVGDIAKIAQMAMMFVNRGGKIPHYDSGGDISDGGYNVIDDQANMPFSTSAIPSFRTMMEHTKNPFSGSIGNADMGMLSTGFPTPAATSSAGPNFNDRFKGSPYAPNRPEVPEFNNPSPVKPGTVPLPTPYPGPGALGKDAGAIRLDTSTKPDEADDEVTTTPAKAASTAYNPPGRAAANPYMQPQAQQPYPDSLKRDWGQNATRSPWMALVKAGATMAASPGPIGSVIGKGILAGTGSLEGQRKELRTEQELNDKAQALYQNAQVHLDKYTKMTPYEQESVKARNREIDQAGEAGTGVGMPKETDIKRVMDSFEKSLNPEDMRTYMGMTYDQKRAAAIRVLRSGAGAAAPAAAAPTGPGSSKDTALPDPGDGKREVGKWYIHPKTGVPTPWVGTPNG